MTKDYYALDLFESFSTKALFVNLTETVNRPDFGLFNEQMSGRLVIDCLYSEVFVRVANELMAELMGLLGKMKPENFGSGFTT